jgi:hypothetical protein
MSRTKAAASRARALSGIATPAIVDDRLVRPMVGLMDDLIDGVIVDVMSMSVDQVRPDHKDI